MTNSLAMSLGFVGGGVMAEAILSRLIASGTSQAKDIFVREISDQRSQYLQDEYGVSVCSSFEDLTSSVEVLLLAIKPQIFAQNSRDFTLPSDSKVRLVLSIMAGTSINAMEKIYPETPIIRVMPNTPATVGSGISALALGSQASDSEHGISQTIFEAVGSVVTVPESSMDAVTALSGSGPAYVAIAVEALSDAGVSVGLPRAIASQLALQTVRGSADLLHYSQIHPAVMKDKVASPGGTTIAGIAALEKAGVRNAFIEAVQAAYHRSRALAQLSED
ncbi:MAG: pyrroline-5-carboxylate reductase [Acaryochloridaceae cyanobacterium RL_2_7]|nr:pyrroline-5-carboxylate reductase [Acaryochloridaceae cyanobacterium RL_2_7]